MSEVVNEGNKWCQHFWSAWFKSGNGVERACTYCGRVERIEKTYEGGSDDETDY